MKIYFAFVRAILTLSLVSAISIQRLIVKNVVVDIKPNPYVKSLNFKIDGEYNDTLTTKMPIYEKIPDDIVLNNYVIYNGAEMPVMRSELCALFDDETFMPDVIAAGIPKDLFPTQCPILPNDEYTILNYKFSSEKLPPGLPDGTISSTIYVSRNGDDDAAFLIIRAELLLQMSAPQISSLMG